MKNIHHIKNKGIDFMGKLTAKSPLKTGALRSAFIYRGRCGGFRGRQSHRVVTTKWPVLLGLKGQEEGMASRTQDRVVWRGPS